MNTLQRYFLGFNIGNCFFYMLRNGFDIFPASIMFLCLIIAIIDLVNNAKSR